MKVNEALACLQNDLFSVPRFDEPLKTFNKYKMLKCLLFAV